MEEKEKIEEELKEEPFVEVDKETKEELVEHKETNNNQISNFNIFLIILLLVQITVILFTAASNTQKHNSEWCRSQGYGPNISIYKGVYGG